MGTESNGDRIVMTGVRVSRAVAQAAVSDLLAHIGEDTTRDGLVRTPERVVRALVEMTEGYSVDPAAVLGGLFEEPCDELVVVGAMPFSSLCEHHLLPFTGQVTIGYLPGAGVVGLSKLARLVHCYSKRLQVQERLTRQLADALVAPPVSALGVGVVVEATHSCMTLRGARTFGRTTTSVTAGAMRDTPSLRAEFLALARERG